ncbi:hypothetical protein GCM10023116_09160 [Kistimonas scapharcae]|uniref:Uncharacterized protein n=1 Tax=Kistimonas scapharcae TaxID=1036133 RepID=A0ABP8UYN7_9GAMM
MVCTGVFEYLRFSAYTLPAYHNPEEEIHEALSQLCTLKERLTPFRQDLVDLAVGIGEENIQPMTEEILTSIRDSLGNHVDLVVKRISILIDHQIKLIDERIKESTPTEIYIKATTKPITITEAE